jgi:hypothetical protein
LDQEKTLLAKKKMQALRVASTAALRASIDEDTLRICQGSRQIYESSALLGLGVRWEWRTEEQRGWLAYPWNDHRPCDIFVGLLVLNAAAKSLQLQGRVSADLQGRVSAVFEHVWELRGRLTLDLRRAEHALVARWIAQHGTAAAHMPSALEWRVFARALDEVLA